jgi:hypothetical protein
LRLSLVVVGDDADARLRWFSFECCIPSAAYGTFAAAVLQHFLGDRSEFLRITFLVRHIDLGEDVGRWLGLRMQALDAIPAALTARLRIEL